jgi:hypothetical protein
MRISPTIAVALAAVSASISAWAGTPCPDPLTPSCTYVSHSCDTGTKSCSPSHDTHHPGGCICPGNNGDGCKWRDYTVNPCYNYVYSAGVLFGCSCADDNVTWKNSQGYNDGSCNYEINNCVQ